MTVGELLEHLKGFPVNYEVRLSDPNGEISISKEDISRENFRDIVYISIPYDEEAVHGGYR